jgi:VanZ family protein
MMLWFGGQVTRRTLGRLLWAALAAWACAILFLSSLTPQELPEAAFLFWDKANHFVAYAVGGWLAASALRVSKPHAPTTRLLILAILLIAAFGALDEAVQTFTPGRSGADVDDWVADVLGATAGALLTLPTLRRRQR